MQKTSFWYPSFFAKIVLWSLKLAKNVKRGKDPCQSAEQVKAYNLLKLHNFKPSASGNWRTFQVVRHNKLKILGSQSYTKGEGYLKSGGIWFAVDPLRYYSVKRKFNFDIGSSFGFDFKNCAKNAGLIKAKLILLSQTVRINWYHVLQAKHPPPATQLQLGVKSEVLFTSC